MAQPSAEKFEQAGPAEKERVASMLQSEQLVRTPEPPKAKEKKAVPINRRISVVVRSPTPFELVQNAC